MQDFLVTIPDLDVVDRQVSAISRIQAARKVLSREAKIDLLDLDHSLEIIVQNEVGRKSVFDARPKVSLSFLFGKAG